jgi:hypothetical protein
MPTLKLGMQEATAVHTIIDVLQIHVFLDIEADSPAVQQHHQDGDVLWNTTQNEAATCDCR